MDIQREDIARQKRRRRMILGGAGVVAALAITLGLSRLKPAAPTVDKSTVWFDAVKRGPMERQVRGPGSLATRNEIEKKRLAVYSQAEKAQLDAQQARVEQLRALAKLKRSQLGAMRVRAGIRGVLQEIPVQPGQRVTPGTTLARVVQP